MLSSTFYPGGSAIRTLVPGGKSFRTLPSIVYVITDDAQLAHEIVDMLAKCEVPTRWFTSSSSFLAHQRMESCSCLLVDQSNPDISDDDLQRWLSAGEGFPPIILLSNKGDVSSCVRAFRSGAHDFLTLPIKREELIAVANAALKKDWEARAGRRELDKLLNRWKSLTSREAEVMRYAVAGFLNKQTAAELQITENTVQVHRGRVMRKMRAQSFAELVRMSLKLADSGENALSNLPGTDAAIAATPLYVDNLVTLPAAV